MDCNYSLYSKKVRVNTHSATEEFKYNKWLDVSPNYPDLEEYNTTKLMVGKKGIFGDIKTKTIYDTKRKEFNRKNTTDTFQSTNSWVDIPGFKSNGTDWKKMIAVIKLLVESSPGARHKYMSRKW